jgi:serine/threonine protein kinase
MTTTNMKSSPPSSPFGATVKAIHPQMAMNRMKPVKDECLAYVGAQDSISQLSFCVNDSASGKSFDQVYNLQGIIGQGIAIVYKCCHKETKNSYAVKEILKEEYESSGENWRTEIDALKRLCDGPYIVRLLDVFYQPDRIYMIMEELTGGDLLEKIFEKGTYEERDARRLSRTLLEAIAFCHRKNIVHRDIKPENILIVDTKNDTKIKLADFGSARRITGPHCCMTMCGTPQYVAPEIYTHTDGYDERCDLWSAAVVIYVILGGYAPFEAPTYQLATVICEGWYEFHEDSWKDISEAPKELITMLLKVDPNERATVEQALDSEWLCRRDKQIMDDSMSSFDKWLKLSKRNLFSDSSATAKTFNMNDSFANTKPFNVHDDSFASLRVDSFASLRAEDLEDISQSSCRLLQSMGLEQD